MMAEKRENRVLFLVVLLRILVGGAFVVSGLSKAIDTWGFVYKIEQYFAVWGVEIERQLSILLASSLSIVEFLMGGMILFGCYRRVSVWFASAFMAVMTSFSLYLVVANPVSDCGCFGELVKVGNWPTLIKNIVLCAALFLLVKHNRKIKGFYNTYLNWVVLVLLVVYVAVVTVEGVTVQPIVDFRDYKIGTNLFADDSDYTEVVYSRDGVTKRFTPDNLPDSTWAFVEVVASEDSRMSLSVFAGDEEGDEVTEEIASQSDKMMLVSLPELEHVAVSNVKKLQNLKEKAEQLGVSFVAITGSGNELRNKWKALSLDAYPLYVTDDTLLKAIVRGEVGLVYVEGGRVVWKSTADNFFAGDIPDDLSADPTNRRLFMALNIALLLALSLLKIIDASGRALKPRFYGKSQKKLVNLPVENTDMSESADDTTSDTN